MTHRKIRISTLFAIAVLILSLGLPAAAGAQTEPTTLYVNPTTSNATTCPASPITVAISVGNVEDLTAFHLEISFDPEVIQVDEIEPAEFIIEEGELYLPEPSNEIDNETGFISWGLAKQGTGGDPNPVSGTGDLILITLHAIVPNQSSTIDIDEENSILVNWPNAFEIPFTATDGVVNTSSCSPTDIDLTNNTIQENMPVDTTIGTFSSTDPDEDTTFTYTLVEPTTYPDNASFTIDGNTLKSYESFNYETKSSYHIRVRSTDPWGAYYEEVFSILIIDVNDAPVLIAIGDKVVNELEEVTFTATATDEDIPSQTFTFNLVNAPEGASINSSSGLFSWAPSEEQGPGIYTFGVCVSDGELLDCETITVTVNEVNVAPVLAPIGDTTINELVTLTFTASATDSDIPVQILTFSLVGAPIGATIDPAAGAFSWTPSEEQGPGSYTFTVKVCDNGTPSLCDQEEITVMVSEVNTAPVAVDDNYITPMNRVLNVLVPGVLTNDSDADLPANTLTVVLVTDIPAGEGTLVLASNGAFSYTPPLDFLGTTHFTYKVFDGMVYSNVATVSITVTDANLPPTDITMTDQTILENQPIGTVVSYLSSEDPNLGDTFTYSLVTGAGDADNTSFSISGNQLLSAVVFDYESKNSYTVRIRTTDQGDLWFEKSFVITILNVNDAPVADNQTVTTPEDTALAITLTGSDQDGDTLSFAVIAQPTHGILTGTASNLTYTPFENYNGPDSFTFIADDGQLVSNVATVNITVTPVNDAPIAHNLSVTTPEDTTLDISLDASDVDGDPLTATIVSGPTHGTVTISGLVVTYTPALNYHGADSFTYTVNDGTADSNVATVSITVTSVNDAPVANDQSITTSEDTAINITLDASDVDGDPLTATIVSGPTHGTVTISGLVVTYTPALNYHGADSFTYTVNDGTADSNVATVSITVTSVNDAPVANNATVETLENTPVNFELIATDADGDPLTFVIVLEPAHGTLSCQENYCTYTPDSHWFGTDSLVFKVNDGQADSNEATVELIVHPLPRIYFPLIFKS